jgi:peroxiredoxin
MRRALAITEGLKLLADGEADAGFEKLEKGKLHAGHMARLRLEAGQKKKALEVAEKWARRDKAFSMPLATLAWIQHACGEVDAARKTFEQVRALSGHADADLLCLQRLDPIAEELGHEGDWRIEAKAPEDVGRRVALETLGPFRWSPMRVPSEWTLRNGDGAAVSSSAYGGRAHLVVFFLGFDCLHCVEQLQALVPHARAFEDAGIDIVTIGSSTVGQIKQSQDDSPFPFTILADPELEVFKRWRCHDDFEKLALHGTFLVDGAGFVRWQDISYEPFMEVEWLLGESKRLLNLPSAVSSSGGGSK